MGVCEEKMRLLAQHQEAVGNFERVEAQLHEKIGTSSKEEFQRLQQAVDQAWATANTARTALEQHIRDHGCNDLSRNVTTQN